MAPEAKREVSFQASYIRAARVQDKTRQASQSDENTDHCRESQYPEKRGTRNTSAVTLMPLL